MKPDAYCILVAEDNPILRYTTVRLLARQGYCVLQAADGREAVLKFRQHDGTVHVLVTNVRMPELDGHQLADLLRKVHPELKVLIVSAEHEKDFPLEARAYDYALLKPAHPESILAAVEQLLRERGDTTVGDRWDGA